MLFVLCTVYSVYSVLCTVHRFNASSGMSAEWFSRLWTADYNARVDCTSACLSDMDLTKWKES